MSIFLMSDVSIGYTDTPLLEGINLRVDEGEVVALLGRNGAGKTSTLLTASGLVKPRAGTTEFLGEVVDYRRPHRNAQRGLAHVPEGRCVFSKLTVAENLRAGAPRRKPDAVLEYFPILRPLLQRPAGLLSGGEQQMLVIARAMMAQPKLLLVDEMSMGLSPLLTQTVLEQLRVMADELRVGVLVVEQFVHMVLRAADRAYVLGQGGIVFSGSATELEKQTDIVSAAYLGEVVPLA